MPRFLSYAGIGSRETPADICEIMTLIAYQLADRWTLRSGHADGADMAFEKGCLQYAQERSLTPNMEIFLPWKGFNNAPDMPEYIVPNMNQNIYDLSSMFHPAWDKCSDAAKKLLMRNCFQVLASHADMVVCWTKDGKASGGTGQALRLAEYFKIPIFNLAIVGVDTKLCEFIQQQEKL